jgi:hypothetical protein
MSRNLPVVPRPAADRPDLLRPTRRSTPSVSVGGVLVGSAHPIVVTTMRKTARLPRWIKIRMAG